MGESRFIGVALAAALCGVPAGARADEPIIMKPVSGWVMDYADDACALRRTFGSEDRPVWLELRQFAPSFEFLVTVATGSFKMVMRAPRSRFLPDGPERTQDLAAYGAYGEGVEAVMFPDDVFGGLPGPWVDTQRDERERSITGLQIESTFKEDFILQTGELHRPMTAMRTCLDDLLRSWKIDPEVSRTLSRPATPVDINRWAAPIRRLFPTGLYYVSGTPSVVFRLLIDDVGNVESCKVQRPVVHQDYEDEICGIILKRAKFSPALDAAGQPVRSLYTQRVVYSKN